MINDTKYIKVKIENMAAGDHWVFKPNNGNGVLVKDPNAATLFTEAEAFAMRTNIVSQLPNEIAVTFDLRK